MGEEQYHGGVALLTPKEMLKGVTRGQDTYHSLKGIASQIQYDAFFSFIGLSADSKTTSFILFTPVRLASAVRAWSKRKRSPKRSRARITLALTGRIKD